MDKHLTHLVKQTERYTSMLTENMKSGGEVGLSIHRRSNSNRSYSSDGNGYDDYEDGDGDESVSRYGNESLLQDNSLDGNSAIESSSSTDEDFMSVAEELDDESTLLVEESLGRDIEVSEELNILKSESEIPIAQLKAMYGNIPDDDLSENDDSISENNSIVKNL